jgi:hypothetical protein
MTRLIGLVVRVSLVLPVLGSLNCAPPQAVKPDPGPGSVLREYRGHLQNRQPGLAYRLLSSRMKKQLDRKDLERFLSENSGRLAGYLQSRFEGQDVELTVRATLRSEDGGEIQLVREPQGWRIDSGALVPPTGATPADAVQRFLLAIESGDCEALLDCAPPSARARHTRSQLLRGCRKQIDSLQKTSAQIRASGSRPVKTSDSRAELTFRGAATGRKLVVVKYQGRWYLEDLF